MERALQPKKRSRIALVALALACAPLMAGCAANRYAGIPLAAGTADRQIQALAWRARAGDKRAQLALGIRYEEGRGVPVDRRRAERLYRLAATDSVGTMWVYQPPFGKNTSGHVVPVGNGVRQSGLAEARARLERLQ